MTGSRWIVLAVLPWAVMLNTEPKGQRQCFKEMPDHSMKQTECGSGKEYDVVNRGKKTNYSCSAESIEMCMDFVAAMNAAHEKRINKKETNTDTGNCTSLFCSDDIASGLVPE